MTAVPEPALLGGDAALILGGRHVRPAAVTIPVSEAHTAAGMLEPVAAEWSGKATGRTTP